MKKFFYIFFYMFFLFFSSNAQTVTAFDGSEFTVGDSVLIGKKKKSGGYNHYRYLYKYDTKGSTYKKLNRDLKYKKYYIKNIRDNNGKLHSALIGEEYPIGENDPVLNFGRKGFFGLSYYMDLNNAIRYGEIILREKENIINTKHLNDTLFFICFIKTSSDSIEKFKDEYLYRFHKSLYIKNHEDEFEFHGSLNKAKLEIEDKIENNSFSDEYSIYTELMLNDYKFEKNGFPFNEKSLKRRILLKEMNYEALYIVFPNFSDYSFLEIKPELANSFLKRRKNKHGDINRKVYAKINFSLQNKVASEKSKRFIYGNIKSIEVFEFDNYRYNWLGDCK